jgi:CBS domain-containing protein
MTFAEMSYSDRKGEALMGIEEIGGNVLVRDIMTSPVITAKKGNSIEKIAKIMEENDIGSVIVVDDKENPLGIVTERDIVKRVVSKNILPSKFKVEDAMSAPLVTISAEASVSEAARIMSRLKIRRLGVFYKGRLDGVVSSKNIVAVTPELMDILTEKARITRPNQNSGNKVHGESLLGYCDECGHWSTFLKVADGKNLCEDCRAEEEDEQEEEST